MWYFLLLLVVFFFLFNLTVLDINSISRIFSIYVTLSLNWDIFLWQMFVLVDIVAKHVHVDGMAQHRQFFPLWLFSDAFPELAKFTALKERDTITVLFFRFRLSSVNKFVSIRSIKHTAAYASKMKTANAITLTINETIYYLIRFVKVCSQLIFHPP